MSEVERLRSGDRKVLEGIYEECFGSISHWIKKNSGTEKDAEDVFQEAMIATYQKSMDENFVLHCKLSTFIFGVAKKIWLYRLRSKGRYVHTDFGAEVDLPNTEEALADELMEQAEIDKVYKTNFEKLTEECKQVLTHFFNGTAMSEIMRLMGFSNDAMARKKKFRCKNELIKLVENDPLYHEIVTKSDA